MRSVFLAPDSCAQPRTSIYGRRILLLPTPIDVVEPSPFAVITNPVASGLVQLTPAFEQFARHVPALVAYLITTAAVSARGFPFAFATSCQQAPALVLVLVLTVV
jgi:hypothetical protein